MTRSLFFCLLFLASGSSIAESLPVLPSSDSPYKLFISSQKQLTNQFDSWTIDSGYRYPIFDSVDIYLGTRLDSSSETNNENGFLSGISYSFNDNISIKSTLHTITEESDTGGKEKKLKAEVSSLMRLTENLDLRATVDYDKWQQGIEVGLGFNF